MGAGMASGFTNEPAGYRDDPKDLARLLIKLVQAEGGVYVGEAALIRVFDRRWDQLNVLAHRLHRALHPPMTAVQRAAMKADRQQVWKHDANREPSGA